MVAKFALVALLVAAASAVPLAPIAKLVEADHAPAHYEFSYSVHDPHTGDVKEQQETRNGDAVQGHYSLAEADGTRRVVHYTADAHNGFNAQVTHEGHPQPAKVAYAPVAKVLAAPAHHVTYAAPAHHVAVAAPAHHVTYAAPAHHVTYSAPAHHVALAAPAHHVTYAAPAHHVALAAPVAKVAAAHLAQVSFASPVYSYHH